MTKSPRKNVPDVGIELGAACMPSELASDRATAPGRGHSELAEKYNVSLRNILQQGISEPEFYSDLVYRIRKIVVKFNFSEQFR